PTSSPQNHLINTNSYVPPQKKFTHKRGQKKKGLRPHLESQDEVYFLSVRSGLVAGKNLIKSI
ncbi:hypothetical protein ACR2XX_27415, partial [Klebsiella pneumoniae]